jgi:hypothetical protein
MFINGFKNIAFVKLSEAGSSPQIDLNKAKQMQQGATQSGWNPAAWKTNLMGAFSASPPPPAPKNVGHM